MIYLLDTNILVRLANPQSPQEPLARKSIRYLLEEGHTLVTGSQVIQEFFTVATRPLSARGGLGMSVPKVLEHISDFEEAVSLLSEVPLHNIWLRLVSKYEISGVAAHDARLAAFMIAHQISHILTFNDKDFSRYAPEGIIAVTPQSVFSN
jgi:predicted nucleic acid-binding protein